MKIKAVSHRRHAGTTDRGGIAATGLAALAVIAALTFASAISAMPAQIAAAGATRGDTYEIDMHVIAGGGERTQGGCFDLIATIGQAVIGRATGGDFVLQAGFWPAVTRDDAIFLNGFEDGSCPP